MHSAETPKPSPRPLVWWFVISLGIGCGLLTLWSWQKWDKVWIERSETFFPPEWQEADLDTLAWKYPIYRSNDTYEWVHVADALAAGDHTPLYHRFDEGLAEGRPNRWHSGLAYLLRASGAMTATLHDWPTQRGIHNSAHWLGACIQLCALMAGAALISRLAGKRAALLFAGLYYFNAAIAWDFSFSRLDHEACFQFFLLFHLLGLAGIFTGNQTHKARNWALLAGISAGFCWWISATTMSALSALITLGLALECYRVRKEIPSELPQAILYWGASAAGMIALLSLCDGRFKLDPSIATIHPIFILAQVGAAIFCLAILQNNKTKQALTGLISLILSLSPLAWLCIYKTEAHPWLNPMMRRLHDYIVEFQSPFNNGLWSQAESLQAAAILIVAALTLRHWKTPRTKLFSLLLAGLTLLAIMQTRWLGFLATVAVLTLVLQLKHKQMPIAHYLSLTVLILSAGTWAYKWTRIEANPGRIFVTDLMLKVGARDINLNLQRLSGGETIQVAMPYAFAASAALFPEIHPIGTFYWENNAGIQASSNFFAGKETDAPIDFAVVQGGRQGGPFAKIANWVAREDISPASIESSLAWQLSAYRTPPTGWLETPYYGTFGIEQFSVRIYQSVADPTNN
jgi:hypothetical protein